MDNELWLAVVTLLLGGGGITAAVVKALMGFYEKKLEHRHTLELKSLEKPVRSSMQSLDAQYDLVHKLKSDFRASFVTIIRMSNGTNFADKSHKWKFTATTTSGMEDIRQALQERSLYEAPKMFGRLERSGIAYTTDILALSDPDLLWQRLKRKNVRAYCFVMMDNCLNGLLICWDKAVDINDTIAQTIKSELLTIEKHIL